MHSLILENESSEVQSSNSAEPLPAPLSEETMGEFVSLSRLGPDYTSSFFSEIGELDRKLGEFLERRRTYIDFADLCTRLEKRNPGPYTALLEPFVKDYQFLMSMVHSGTSEGCAKTAFSFSFIDQLFQRLEERRLQEEIDLMRTSMAVSLEIGIFLLSNAAREFAVEGETGRGASVEQRELTQCLNQLRGHLSTDDLFSSDWLTAVSQTLLVVQQSVIQYGDTLRERQGPV